MTDDADDDFPSVFGRFDVTVRGALGVRIVRVSWIVHGVGCSSTSCRSTTIHVGRRGRMNAAIAGVHARYLGILADERRQVQA